MIIEAGYIVGSTRRAFEGNEVLNFRLLRNHGNAKESSIKCAIWSSDREYLDKLEGQMQSYPVAMVTGYEKRSIYEAQDGQNKVSVEIVVNRIEMIWVPERHAFGLASFLSPVNEDING